MSALVVWMADTPVGRLIRKDNGNLQFRYDEAYSGPAVSQALPRHRRELPAGLRRGDE